MKGLYIKKWLARKKKKQKNSRKSIIEEGSYYQIFLKSKYNHIRLLLTEICQKVWTKAYKKQLCLLTTPVYMKKLLLLSIKYTYFIVLKCIYFLLKILLIIAFKTLKTESINMISRKMQWKSFSDIPKSWKFVQNYIAFFNNLSFSITKGIQSGSSKCFYTLSVLKEKCIIFFPMTYLRPFSLKEILLDVIISSISTLFISIGYVYFIITKRTIYNKK